jgi:hypothetical protein
MDFQVNYLSFYVIETRDDDKIVKHFQTLDEETYENSPLRDFLDGEFAKIAKRKVERHPKSENVPTKIGRFIVEDGHGLDSNPNYNMFFRVRNATDKETFKEAAEKIVYSYIETSAIRGGVLIIANAKLRKYYDDPFVFILKCDFEPKVASITDESTLIQNVEMAITTKNMKSIQYPYMPEEGMIEEGELKIHQASHARYFEDFLKFVEYGESMPEIIKSQVMNMVKEQYEAIEPDSFDQEQLEEAMEIWAASSTREIQEHFEPEQVMEAAVQIMEHTPDAELKFKLNHISVKGLLSDFGESIHIAKNNGKYMVLIEADSITFDKGYSPIEFLKPFDLQLLMEKLNRKMVRQ